MSRGVSYERRRPEETTLYQVVQDNLATLYGAVDDGAVAIALPRFVRKELEGYLDCGLLCRGFARLRCEGCTETRLVAFSCKGRGFCPSCLGRKMSATAAHLMEDVLPQVALRQWVLTVPFAWRKRLGYDGPLLSALTRMFVKTVLDFYREQGAELAPGGQSGAVVAVQRTSSDLKLNPHVHAVLLDGVAHDPDGKGDGEGELAFETLSHLSTRDVARVLERTRDRVFKYLRRRGLLADDELTEDPLGNEGLVALAASAAGGAAPPAGPEWRRGARPLSEQRQPMVFERPLCVSLDGFTLHAATRAGGFDEAGREALLKYILRPAVAQERITLQPDGLIRIALKKAFSDGTVAIDLDPLSLLSRLAASVPAPRFHTVRYAGALGSASKLRARLVPKTAGGAAHEAAAPAESPRRSCYRPWAELLMRTFGLDVLACPRCEGRMRLLALVTEPARIARALRALGEPTELPARSPARGPPY